MGVFEWVVNIPEYLGAKTVINCFYFIVIKCNFSPELVAILKAIGVSNAAESWSLF